MTNQLPLSGTAAEISQGDAVEIAARKVGACPEGSVRALPGR